MIEIDVASGRLFLSVLMVWMRVMSEIKQRLVLLCERQKSQNLCVFALFCRRKAGEKRCKQKLRVRLLNSSDGILYQEPVSKTKSQNSSYLRLVAQ